MDLSRLWVRMQSGQHRCFSQSRVREEGLTMAHGTDVMTRIKVKVIPRASKNEIVGWSESVLRVRVRATPEKGRANEAVESLLAEKLGLPLKSVCVVTGHTSSRKILEITGLDLEEVQRKLGV